MVAILWLARILCMFFPPKFFLRIGFYSDEFSMLFYRRLVDGRSLDPICTLEVG